jgi:hypothetical protein
LLKIDSLFALAHPPWISSVEALIASLFIFLSIVITIRPRGCDSFDKGSLRTSRPDPSAIKFSRSDS